MIAVLAPACVPAFAPFEPASAPDAAIDGGVPIDPDGGEELEPPDAAIARYAWRTIENGGPTPRDRHSMVYSTKSRKLLLIGGIGFNDAGTIVHRDTWSWDGQQWIEESPAHTFRLGVDHAAAEDQHGNIVLFAGATTNYEQDPSADTWIWDGSDWTQRMVDPHPAARRYSAMAYDERRRTTILYGGRDVNDGPLGDTWEWTGNEWIDRTPPPGDEDAPAPRAKERIVFDSARQELVMFGGETTNHTGYFDDTWSWDGERWHRIATRSTPTPRAAVAMGYDEEKNVIFIFGGEDDQHDYLSESWQLHGDAWRPVEEVEAMPAVRHPAMAYDRAARRMILFGGFKVGEDPDNTWALDAL